MRILGYRELVSHGMFDAKKDNNVAVAHSAMKIRRRPQHISRIVSKTFKSQGPIPWYQVAGARLDQNTR